MTSGPPRASGGRGPGSLGSSWSGRRLAPTFPALGACRRGVFPGEEQGEDPASLEEGRGFGEPSRAGASRARVLEEAEGLRAWLEQARSRGEFGAWVVRHKVANRSASPLSAARLWEGKQRPGSVVILCCPAKLTTNPKSFWEKHSPNVIQFKKTRKRKSSPYEKKEFFLRPI